MLEVVKSLLVTSLESYSGKSGFIVAFGKILEDLGFRIGYFKPIGIYTGKVKDTPVDEDALITAESLGCEEKFKSICPVLINKPYHEFVLKNYGNKSALIEKIKNAYTKLAKNKDIILIESIIDYAVGKFIELDAVNIAKLFNSKILVVAKYNDFVLDKILAVKDKLGDLLEFVVFNYVPMHKRESLLELAEKMIKDKPLVLGAIPKDPMLSGVFISEIAETLNGEILVEFEKDEIIEELLVGAMSTHTAMTYFRSAKNSALIVAGDRPDLQVIALENPNIKCLVLTRNIEPPKPILGKAKLLKKPIILVKDDTANTIEKIHELFGKIRIKGEKVERMKNLVKKYIDTSKLVEHLSLTKH